MKWLLFGGKGWIGSYVCDILSKDQDNEVVFATCRADNEAEVLRELISVNPDRVVSLVGRTSGPGYTTIDYLEQKGKLVENVRDNLYGPFVLAQMCKEMDIHLTYMGTGCIFNGYKEDIGYKESDQPDFFGSGYSTVKGFTDRIMHFFDQDVLNVRIRMPITADNSPKNFIVKILTYEKICSTPNSMTVLPELLPIMLDMAKKKEVGTINLTNPGMIEHNEILQLVKDMIKPDFTWNNFTIEEQDKILLGGRSNDLLNTDKLQNMYPEVLDIRSSIVKTLEEMKENNVLNDIFKSKE